ncbi:heavy metal translocating P-type ATPase [Janibacter corallicola]|uniref:heavy metal translocating P-type ATPase n=1 Tax=Janibacter corallicola TaxID=415212 RepID=UPI000830FF68|nr:heavy metal translocating P-type ATPase [Janibacter corallicola]
MAISTSLLSRKSSPSPSGDGASDEVASTEQSSTPAAMTTGTPLVERLRTPEPTPTQRGDLARRGLVALVLAVVTVAIDQGDWGGAANPWIQLVAATAAIGWPGLPFLREAVIRARQGTPTAEVLTCLGIVLAWLWSLGVAATGAGAGGRYYFGAAAAITALLIGSRWLEARGRDEGRAATDALLDLGAPDVAVQRIDSRTRATTEVRLPVEELQVGDHFIVRPGEKVALDGVVIDGASAVDTSLITGKDEPESVRTGHRVHAGTLNTTGRLVVEARAVGEDTTFAAIRRIVERSRTGSTKLQERIDRYTAILVPAVAVLAVLAFVGWWIGSGSVGTALGVAIAVLVVASPAALAIAASLALLVGTSRGVERGVLVTGPQMPETAADIDTFVLDKTGTITTGVAQVTDLAAAPGLHPAAVLTAAAAVESGSEHPIARAIIARAEAQHIKVPRTTGTRALPGQGISAKIKDMRVTVGRAELFDDVPAELATLERAGTTVFVGWEGKARGALTVSDEVRETSGDAIRALRARGLQVWLLSGDNAHHAKTVAERVGIDPAHVLSDVRHKDKASEIARLRGEGHVVAVLGDGLHDTAGAREGELAMALGADTKLGRELSDVTLVHGDLVSAPRAMRVLHETVAVMRQNLLALAVYHALALVLVLAGLIGPLLAGVAMALASVVVVGNSLRLRKTLADL